MERAPINPGTSLALGALATALCVHLGGCEREGLAEADSKLANLTNTAAEHISTGDLSHIRDQGILRILTPQPVATQDNPHQRYVVQEGLRVCEAFAQHIKLKSVAVLVNTSADMVAGLLEGKGDIACGRPLLPDSDTITTTRLSWQCQPDLKTVSQPWHHLQGTLVERCTSGTSVRADNPDLQKAVYNYLHSHHLTFGSALSHTEDLDGIKQRGVLRLLTLPSPSTFFSLNGQLRGFEYELMRKFASYHQLELDVVVVPERADLLPMLRAGKGDVVAAFMTDQLDSRDIVFTEPYHYADQVVIGSRDELVMTSAEQLRGRRIIAHRASTRWKTLEALQASGLNVELVAAPEDSTPEKLIAGVGRGTYDLAVADKHILQAEMAWRGDVTPLWTLVESQPQAWAVRANSLSLRAALNAFADEEYRGLFYNWTHDKYFTYGKKLVKQRRELLLQDSLGRLSPHDGIVKQYAAIYGFDWRLLTALMYQESRFKPKSVSSKGAQGLMQVMPRTAKALGIAELDKPENGIHAGVKHLAQLRSRLSPELSIQDQTWFSLAAYNAGAGRLRDARSLARELGWNPDRWFDNVEQAMALLAEPRYGDKARFGRFRADESIRYVREIRDRYLTYVALIAVNNGH